MSIVKDAIANILSNLIWNNIDNIEKLSSIQTTKEYFIINQLEDLDDKGYSLDYDLIVKAWSDFLNNIKEINRNHQCLVDKIKKEFSLKTPDDFLIIGTMVNHEKFIKKNLDIEYRKLYENYLEKVNEIILDFKIEFLRYYEANLTDDFFTSNHIISQKNIKYKDIEVNTPTIYLDQNTIEKIMNDERMKIRFLDLKNSQQYTFVYSPHLIEDAINMNPLFLRRYIDFLKELTGCKMIDVYNSGNPYVYEDIIDTYSRVEKYKDLRETYERVFFVRTLNNYYSFPELRKNGKLNNEINSSIVEFFKSKKIHRSIIYNSMEFKFSSKSIMTFINEGEIEEVTLGNILTIIEELIELFDFINFETEKVSFSNIQKIFSRHRDNQHIIYSHKCDYLLTNDKFLRNRANVIFSLIDSNTKVMTEKEFFKNVNGN